MAAPNANDLIARALALTPLVRKHADQAERDRHLPTEVARAFATQGLLRAGAPAEFGGSEADPEIRAILQRHLALPRAWSHCDRAVDSPPHAHDLAWISPILAFTSPEKRCGKTTALQLVSGSMATA